MSQSPGRESPLTQESTNCRASDDAEYPYFRCVGIDDVRPTTSAERLQIEERLQDQKGAPEGEGDDAFTSHSVFAPPLQRHRQFIDQSDLPRLFQACSISHLDNMTSHCPENEETFKRPVGVPPKSQAQITRKSEQSKWTAHSALQVSTSDEQSSDVLRKTVLCPARGLTASNVAVFPTEHQYEQQKQESINVPSVRTNQDGPNCCSASCDCFYTANEDGLTIPAFRKKEDKLSKTGSGTSSQTEGEEADDADENECECDGDDDENADDEAEESDVDKEEDSSDEEELGFFRDPPIYPCVPSPAEEDCRSPTQRPWSQEALSNWESPWHDVSGNIQETTRKHFALEPNGFQVSEDVDVQSEVRNGEQVQVETDEVVSSVSYNNAHNDVKCPCKRRKKPKGCPRKRRKRRISPRQRKHIKFMLPESEDSSDDDDGETRVATLRPSTFVKKPSYRLGKRPSSSTFNAHSCLCDTDGEGDRHQPKLKRTCTVRGDPNRGKGKWKGKGKGKAKTKPHTAISTQSTSRENKHSDIFCPCLKDLGVL